MPECDGYSEDGSEGDTHLLIREGRPVDSIRGEGWILHAPRTTDSEGVGSAPVAEKLYSCIPTQMHQAPSHPRKVQTPSERRLARARVTPPRPHRTPAPKTHQDGESYRRAASTLVVVATVVDEGWNANDARGLWR